jgi:hypothetical protein
VEHMADCARRGDDGGKIGRSGKKGKIRKR